MPSASHEKIADFIKKTKVSLSEIEGVSKKIKENIEVILKIPGEPRKNIILQLLELVNITIPSQYMLLKTIEELCEENTSLRARLSVEDPKQLLKN